MHSVRDDGPRVRPQRRRICRHIPREGAHNVHGDAANGPFQQSRCQVRVLLLTSRQSAVALHLILLHRPSTQSPPRSPLLCHSTQVAFADDDDANPFTTPTDFILLADVSGSMSGDKIQSVLETLLKVSDMFNRAVRAPCLLHDAAGLAGVRLANPHAPLT